MDRNHPPPWPLRVSRFLAERLRGWPFEDHGLQRRPKTVCPSGLRGDASSASASCVGSNPTIVMLLLDCARIDLLCCARADHAWLPRASLAEWSKALASGASQQGRGLEPRSCHSRWRRFGVSSRSDVFSWSRTPLASATTTAWPCNLRHWLKAQVCKGVGRSPTTVTRFALFCARRVQRAKRSQ